MSDEMREARATVNGDDTPTTADYDRVLDERGTRCPMPVVNLARMTNADPTKRLLLLADDPAAESDVPAWCRLRHRVLAWHGTAPDGRGSAWLVVPPPPSMSSEESHPM